MKLTHLSLFSGIGGIDLAAHWAGFETVAFVEKDEFCQKVLRKNFPGIPIYEDVTTFDATEFRGLALVSGGFPCQDVSTAGQGAGIVEGKRSGLWFEMLRIVRECRPLFVLAENVPGLRTKGIDRVLYGLETSGYTAEPFVVGAGSAGAPHIRKRVFIVGADTDRAYARQIDLKPGTYQSTEVGDMAADSAGVNGERGDNVAQTGRTERRYEQVGASSGPFLPWRVCEPPIPGVDARVPRSMDRIRALGNAVVPAQVYPILKAIADELERRDED